MDGDSNHPQLEQLLLPSLAANTSSPLPGPFAPHNLFKRGRHSTSSNTLFTLSLPLQHFFPPPLLPTHSFLLSKDTPRAHPHHAPQPPKRCLNQPPSAIPAMLSTLLPPFQLVPVFRPLLSGSCANAKHIYIYIYTVFGLAGSCPLITCEFCRRPAAANAKRDVACFGLKMTQVFRCASKFQFFRSACGTICFLRQGHTDSVVDAGCSVCRINFVKQDCCIVYH